VARCVGLDGWHISRAELAMFPDPEEAFARRVSLSVRPCRMLLNDRALLSRMIWTNIVALSNPRSTTHHLR
jgi:hypothetical protein